MELDFRMLGPLEAEVDDRALGLGGPKQRRLLAMLLIEAGRAVSVDRLIDAVWGENPPAAPAATLRTHVANLRRDLSIAGVADLVVTRAPGYCLDVPPLAVDAGRFEQLVADGRTALQRGATERAGQTLCAALGLWRGEVLEDLGTPPFSHAESARLAELRLVALESRVDADLALGRQEQLVVELTVLVDAHPFREHLFGRLMLALYRTGRQADALEVYRDYRQRLGAELGLAPGHELAQLEAAILRHDPALSSTPARTTAPAEGPGRPDDVDTPPGDDPQRTDTPAGPDALFDIVRRVPMVGRAGELEQLRGLWRSVRSGERRVALVAGEAGVGKTRLAAELAAGAAAEDAVVLVGRCEQAALIPYQPVSDALHRSPAAADALAEAPEHLRSHLGRLVAGPAGPHTREHPEPADPEEQRDAFLAAVGQLFARMAGADPVMFVVEEAECIDQASSRLLRHLAHQLPTRMLLLVCFRDPPGTRHPPLLELLADLEGRGLADRLSLEPLDEQDLAALVAAWSGGGVPEGFVSRLWASTGGNPFYANEVVRELAHRGGGAGPHAAEQVPRSVQDVLRERHRALTAIAQRVITCAAVLGRRFELAQLAQLTDLPDGDLVAALEEAIGAGWLVETGRAWEASYAFRHMLMRQAVHSDTPAPERQRLHLRAADALEAAGLHRTSDVAAAAGHLRAAGGLADHQRAARLSLQAAEESADLYAWEEAVGHAEAAVAILDHAGAPPDQLGEAALRAAELLRRSSLDYHRAIDLLETALEHFHAAGDDTGIASVRAQLGHVHAMHHSVLDIPRALGHFAAAEPVLTDGEAAFSVQFGTALAALFGLQTDEGCRSAERAVATATRLGRRELVALARPTLAAHRLNRGELAAAQALATQAWSTADELGDPHLGWEAVTSIVLANNAYLLDPATSASWCRAALSMPRLDTIARARQGVGDQLAFALASMGELDEAHDIARQLPSDAVCRRLLLLLDGDWDAAERSWTAALEHDLGNGDRLNALLNAYWLGQVQRLLGDRDAAAGSLQRALAVSLDGPQVPAELMIRAELARLVIAQGDTATGARHLTRCDDILADGEDWRGQRGAVELARGALAAARGQPVPADDAHRKAAEVFDRHHLPWWHAESLRAWAGWLAHQGRHDDAEQQQATAWTLYDELHAPARWRRAEVLCP